MKLNNWSVVGDNDPYRAPELRCARLHGIVDDHPRLGKNTEISTSSIMTAEGLIVITKSGSVYELGTVDPKYLEYLKENNINFNPEQPITMRKTKMWRIKYFFKWLKWKLEGSQMLSFPGKHCGCCGAWLNEPYTIPAYKSAAADGWWDSWGLCKKGEGCRKGEINATENRQV
jgi:hypothetical protein